MGKIFARTFLNLATTLLAVSGLAYADSITASLFTPLAPHGTAVTLVDVQSTNSTVPTLSTVTGTCNTNTCRATGPFGPPGSGITGNGYSITANVASFEGVVQGAFPGTTSRSGFGVPVAGPTPQYLTGNFNSLLTTNINSAGRYLSTGASRGITPGSITINFTKPETSLALLWGSIDPGNTITFNNTNHSVVNGTEAQNAANTLHPGPGNNGFLGPKGSAYFVIDTTNPFTSVTFTNAAPSSSNFPSFEFTGLAAAGSPFTPAVPEPPSFVLLLSGLVAGVIYELRWGRRHLAKEFE